MLTPADMISNTRLKEEMNIVFEEVNSNIYKVLIDRFGDHSGRLYVNAGDVLDALNEREKVAIFKENKCVHVSR